MVELKTIPTKLAFFALFLLVVGNHDGVTGRPSDDEEVAYFDQPNSGLADDEKNDPFSNSDESKDFKLDEAEAENFGRLIVTEVGTLMCFRAWELDSQKDFHVCNVCFNSTNYPTSKLGRDDYIAQVDSCMNTYLSDTEFKSCQPMLKDPTIPNKPYDILLSEPPFDFPFRNFVRCAHGVAMKQEAVKCVGNAEVIQGIDAFLEKFGCLMGNLLIESVRNNMEKVMSGCSSASRAQVSECLIDLETTLLLPTHLTLDSTLTAFLQS